MSRRDHEANGPLFTNEYTALPANAPPDRPHIIDTEYETECSERGNVNVWDAIATVIFKVSPAKLDMFLDPSNTEFKMDFDMKDYDNDFLIWKKADEVLVSERSFHSLTTTTYKYSIRWASGAKSRKQTPCAGTS